MEELNKVEIVGRVGNIKVTEVSGKKLANLSVATNEVFKGKDGSIVMETTWHNAVCWEKENIDFTNINKGDAVRIVGRLRNQRYTDSNGETRYVTEIVAKEFSKVV